MESSKTQILTSDGHFHLSDLGLECVDVACERSANDSLSKADVKPPPVVVAIEVAPVAGLEPGNGSLMRRRRPILHYAHFKRE